jgi:hypothetical protein
LTKSPDNGQQLGQKRGLQLPMIKSALATRFVDVGRDRDAALWSTRLISEKPRFKSISANSVIGRSIPSASRTRISRKLTRLRPFLFRIADHQLDFVASPLQSHDFGAEVRRCESFRPVSVGHAGRQRLVLDAELEFPFPGVLSSAMSYTPANSRQLRFDRFGGRFQLVDVDRWPRQQLELDRLTAGARRRSCRR